MATFIPLNIELKNEIGTFEPQNRLLLKSQYYDCCIIETISLTQKNHLIREFETIRPTKAAVMDNQQQR